MARMIHRAHTWMETEEGQVIGDVAAEIASRRGRRMALSELLIDLLTISTI